MPIDLKLFNEISARTPNLCHLAPAGPTHMPDLYAAGGIPAVQAELAKKGLLDLDVPTVTGKTLGENIKGAHILNDKAIRPIDNPYSQTGGLHDPVGQHCTGRLCGQAQRRGPRDAAAFRPGPRVQQRGRGHCFHLRG